TAYVVAPERVAEARVDLERRGLPAFLHATMGELDLTYHEAAHTTGHQVELHADNRGLRDFFAKIHDRAWSGTAATHCDRRPEKTATERSSAWRPFQSGRAGRSRRQTPPGTLRSSSFTASGCCRAAGPTG